MMSRYPHRRVLFLAAFLSLATACGSTAQVSSTLPPEPGLATTPGPPGGGQPVDDPLAPGASAASQVPPVDGAAPDGTGSQAAAGPVAAGSAGGRGDASGPGTASGDSSQGPSGPLEVGILYAEVGSANAALGVSMSSTLDFGSASKALVEAYNERGGMVGRRIEPVYHSFDATASNYNEQAAAACARFTQDSPVPVVLDYFFGMHNGMAACLAERGVADLGWFTSDEVATDAAPLFASGQLMTSDRRYRAVLEGLHRNGYATKTNKIGILLESCPDLERAYERTVLPAISSLGLQLADTQTVSCTVGFASAGPMAQRAQAAVLRFRSVGVDRVMIMSDYEQVVLLMLTAQAESQGWRPGYLLSDQSQASAVRPNIPEGQWPGLYGVGWRPQVNIDPPDTPPRQVDRRCYGLVEDGGAAVHTWQDQMFASATCNSFFLLERALQANGGDERGAAVIAAIESLGGDFDAPGSVDGRSGFGADRRDGPATAAPFAFVEQCSCLRYTGPPVAVR